MCKIVLVPFAGICNRMRAIASAMHIVQEMPISLQIYLPKDKDCFIDFSDILSL